MEIPVLARMSPSTELLISIAVEMKPDSQAANIN